MDIIVVNDTNIFIDLISVGLLDDFFRLPYPSEYIRPISC